MFNHIRSKRYIHQLQKERQVLVDKYEQMADLWSVGNHKALRLYEKMIDEMQDQIYSLTY